MKLYVVQLSTNERPEKLVVFASSNFDDCDDFLTKSMFDETLMFTKPPIRNGNAVEFLSDDKDCRIEIVRGTFTEE